MPEMGPMHTDSVDTVAEMHSLGTYREEFLPVVELYVDVMAEYITVHERHKNGGYKHAVKTAQDGLKRSPVSAALEGLRRDIGAYSDRLGLNPKSYGALGVQQIQTSKLEAALTVFANGG